MTSDTHHPFALAGRDFLRSPSIRERQDSLRRARTHSRLVRWLRVLLPVSALAMLGFYFISPKISISLGDMNASVAGIVIEKGNLRMVNPKLEGANDEQGVYVVTARYAEQAVANPDIIHLTELKAEMHDASKGWSRLSAPKGKFETKSEKLELIGDIRAAQSTGMIAHLRRADVDMKTQIVVSREPVRVSFPNGSLESRTMHLNVPEREVEFAGDVRTRMEQARDPAKARAKPAAAASGFAKSIASDQPIDILAPRLNIYDGKKLAYFSGGVTTDQGGSRMTSRDLRILYDRVEDGAAAKPAPEANAGGNRASTKLRLIEAGGGVKIATADGRRASAGKLVYDAARQLLTLDDDVVLSQQGNTLRGHRLISDLAANVTRIPAGGRVAGRFEPKQGEAKPAAAASGQPETKDNGFGGAQLDFSSSQGKPVDVESDTLDIYDDKKLAEFKGNVRAVQGEMTMRSKTLKVSYSGDAAAGAGAPASGGQLTTIRAEGKVLINTGEDQSTTSDWALFDVKGQTVTIGGNVVLSQGDNVIKGDELVIDLKTNRSRFVNRGDSSTRKRVQGLFMPQQPGEDAAKRKPGGQ